MDYDLSAVVTTKEDVDLLTRDLDILLDSLYRSGDASYENTIKKSVRFETVKLLETMGSSRDERKAELEKLKQALRELQLFKMTLAYDPSLETVRKMATWVRANIAKNTVLDIKIDRSIVAGAIIEYSGRYMDMSIAKKLDAALDAYEGL